MFTPSAYRHPWGAPWLNNSLRPRAITHGRDGKEGVITSGPFCQTCLSLLSTLESLHALCSEQGFPFAWDQDVMKNDCELCLALRCFYSLQYSGVQKLYMIASPEDSIPLSKEYPLSALSAKSIYIVNYDDWRGSAHFPYRNIPPNRLLELYVPLGDESARYLTAAMPFPHNMDCDLNMKEAKRKLHDCLSNHEPCRAGTGQLPTRVIDVGVEGSDPKLYISKPNELAKYVALSYCWGEKGQLTTSMSTLEPWMEALPLHILSQGIQDAIIVTRKLGMRYLWVDALCIIQDSYEDKQKEIQKMGKIYTNATLTIAALNSKSVHDGFLSTRLPVEGFKLPFLLPNGNLGNVIAVPHHGIREKEIPLNCRAWTLQEEVLSSRILRFITGDVKWQCRTSPSAPLISSPFGWNSVHEQGFLPIGSKSPDDPIEDIQSSTDSHSSWFWPTIAQDYSKRNITNLNDRLLALAGIASELEIVWNDTFIAGHWKSCMILHLGWYHEVQYDYTLKSYIVPEIPKGFVAPGWSWLSIDAPINMEKFDSIDAKFIDCSVELADANMRLGILKGGSLTIEAATLPAITFKVKYYFDNGSSTITDDLTFVQLGGFKSAFGKARGETGGLILKAAAEGRFRRVGYFREQELYEERDLEAHSNPFDEAERKCFTII